MSTQYTVFYKHTAPHTPWEPTSELKIYGDLAGKPISEEIFMRVVTAKDLQEAWQLAEADACEGWGTIVLLVFEGAPRPIHKHDFIIQLS